MTFFSANAMDNIDTPDLKVQSLESDFGPNWLRTFLKSLRRPLWMQFAPNWTMTLPRSMPTMQVMLH